jgi:hypothetical protein
VVDRNFRPEVVRIFVDLVLLRDGRRQSLGHPRGRHWPLGVKAEQKLFLLGREVLYKFNTKAVCI